MSNDNWSYINNPFETNTRGSFKKMNMLGKDHLDKLAAAAASDAFFQPLFNRTKPAYKAFQQKLTEASANLGIYEGQTMAVQDAFQQLSNKYIKQWDIMVQVEYLDGTPEYKAILPNGRKPFQSGSYESRVKEVQALATRMSAYTALDTLRAKVEEVAARLSATRSKQQGHELMESEISDETEHLRKELAYVLHANFALLLDRFVREPYRVTNYFELQYIRRSSPSAAPSEESALEEEGSSKEIAATEE